MINVAIINPAPTYSQTFINAHIQHIEGNKLVLSKGYLPTKDHNLRPLYRPSLPLALVNRVKMLTKQTTKESLRRGALEKYLRVHKIDLVLAEFGPAGAAIYEICQRVGVPMVVHFHGADAYSDHYLNKLRDEYRKMFDVARYIFVVSRHMYRQLISLGAPEEKLIINTYGPDDTFFKVKPATDKPTLHSIYSR
jgi:hypothetical protein